MPQTPPDFTQNFTMAMRYYGMDRAQDMYTQGILHMWLDSDAIAEWKSQYQKTYMAVWWNNGPTVDWSVMDNTWSPKQLSDSSISSLQMASNVFNLFSVPWAQWSIALNWPTSSMPSQPFQSWFTQSPPNQK